MIAKKEAISRNFCHKQAYKIKQALTILEQYISDYGHQDYILFFHSLGINMDNEYKKKLDNYQKKWEEKDRRRKNKRQKGEKEKRTAVKFTRFWSKEIARGTYS